MNRHDPLALQDNCLLITPKLGVRQIMLQVMAALLPGTLLQAWLFGPAVLLNISAAVLAALMIEALAVWCRSRPVMPVVSDGSVMLAAWLLALTLPPLLPFWQLLIGVACMVLLGKHLYGGLGQNPFNPAMVGYAILLISFPKNMTAWVAPGVFDTSSVMTLLSIKLNFAAQPLQAVALNWDAISLATPLDQLRTIPTDQSQSLTTEQLAQWVTQSQRHWINLGFLSGGLYLLWRRVIRWHIPVSMLCALTILHLLDNQLSETVQMPTHLALLSGGAMLGAFFIATDPVSAATSEHGRLVYGLGIGTLTFCIREFSAYPEGIAFAILLMNITVPTIDYWFGAEPPTA